MDVPFSFFYIEINDLGPIENGAKHVQLLHWRKSSIRRPMIASRGERAPFARNLKSALASNKYVAKYPKNILNKITSVNGAFFRLIAIVIVVVMRMINTLKSESLNKRKMSKSRSTPQPAAD